MAENQIVAEDKHRKSRGLSSTQKGQSLTSGAGTILPSSVPSKPNTLKNVANLTSGIVSHSAKAASMISPENKHHHHHHHHHHSHSHHSTPHVIHRTTSESLRLGGTEVNSANTVTTSTGASSPSTNSSSSGTTNTNCKSGGTPQLHLSAPGMRKPKTSSFQITSVTVGNKLSADNGEDSADDLDESHTDDNSRITDLENETPSMSEDTFSKEDVFFSSNALGTAPVIPTSSQYGLVIVDPDLAGVGGSSGQTLSNVHVSVTDAGINIVGPNGGKLNDGDQKDLQHRNERFKVVKIESTEPFKRGRWMCMDYLDHTTLQQTQSTNPESSSPPQTTTGNVLTNDSGAVNISENHVDGGAEVPESTVQPNFHAQSVSPGQTLQNPVSTSSLEQQPPLSQSTTTNSTGTAPPTVIQAQTIGHVPNAAPSSVIPQAQQQQPSQSTLTAQSLPPAQIQQAIAGQLHPPQEPPVTNQQPASSAPEYQGGSAAPSLQGQSQPANFYLSNQQALANPASTHPHGATLPTNIQMQNGVPTNLPCSTQPPPTPQQPPAQHQQQQQTSQQQTAAAPPNAAMAVPLNSEQTAGSTTSSMSQPAVQQQTGTPQPLQQSGTVPAAQSLTTHSAPQSQVSSDTFVPQATAQSYTTPPVPTAAVPSVSSASSISQDITVDVAAPLPVGQAASIVSPGGATAAIPTPATTTLENGSTTGQQAAPATQGIPNVQDTAAAPGVGASPAAAPPTPASQPSTISDPAVLAAAIQAQQLVTASSAAAATLQTQQSVVTGEESQQPAVDTDNESASGTSAVAIDNKIEQAMDLVKSHLMIAVREEVEVLKEKIAELMDRINQLELENTILKANVSQETLSQLTQTIQTSSTKTPQNTNTSNGPVS